MCGTVLAQQAKGSGFYPQHPQHHKANKAIKERVIVGQVVYKVNLSNLEAEGEGSY